MLWVNMIMDTFAALALATEEPHPKLLLRPPHDRDAYIVTKRMLKHIIAHAVF
jgi:magnesium-transporting ATPase (P-type)